MNLSEHLIQAVDSTPLPSATSDAIAAPIKAAGFGAIDNGHHLLVTTPNALGEPWECAAIYLEDSTLWIKVMAKRWWLLFTMDVSDRQSRYEKLWEAIDTLQPRFEEWGRSDSQD